MTATAPDGWTVVELGAIASLRTQQIVPTEDDRRPYIALEHIETGGGLLGYSEACNAISHKTVFQAGDTLYGKLRVDFDGVCSTDIFALFAKNGAAEDSFVAHLLRSERLHAYAMRGVSGTKMPRTSWGHLQKYVFPLPPLAEQRAIATVLDAIGEAIEAATAVVEAAERAYEALLAELLARGLPGRHASWRETPDLGTLPACWDVMRLGDVAEVDFSSVDKKSVDGEHPVELCNYTDVFYRRRIQRPMDFMRATATVAEYRKWGLRAGDILFTKDSETPDEIGVPAYVAQDMPDVLCGYHLGRARPHPGIVDGTFLSASFRSWPVTRQFSRTANGVIRFGLTLASTRAVRIPLPPLDEQRAIAEVLDMADGAAEAAAGERDALRALETAAREALLTGRVRAGRG